MCDETRNGEKTPRRQYFIVIGSAREDRTWPPQCGAENKNGEERLAVKCLILLVEQRGIEPLTSALRMRFSPFY